MEISMDMLREIVKAVLEESQKREECPQAGFDKQVDPSGVLRIKTETVRCEPYDVGVPANVALRDLVSLQESPRMGCGILEINNSIYPWKLTYDEYYYVIDGTLEIHIDGRKVTGVAGNILYIPKGSAIHFSSPDHCRAVYFTYPADWENS